MTPIEDLPTPLATVLRRQVGAEPKSMESFLMSSYAYEVTIKMIGSALASGLKRKAPERAYELMYELVRADGLGVWEKVIRAATASPLVALQAAGMSPLTAWLTQIRTKDTDEWYKACCKRLTLVFQSLALDDPFLIKKPTVIHAIMAAVQLRNKTKAHGAIGPDFCNEAAEPYSEALEALVQSCPLFRWKWLHLLRRENKSLRVIHLNGLAPRDLSTVDSPDIDIKCSGLYIWTPETKEPFYCGDLIDSNRECTMFFFPNGAGAEASLEYIDYSSGKTVQRPIGKYIQPPAALPPSETQGIESLELQGNVLGNLPPTSSTYVKREDPERRLKELLLDRKHTIITLHGRGGIGKTSLALKICHEIAGQFDCPFEYILWLSARDTDLRASGPSIVKPEVRDLETLSKRFAALLGGDGTFTGLGNTFHGPVSKDGKGILLVLDNFESVNHAKEVQAFLDTHVHIPNKVLITSRERAFDGDFPVPVSGMPDQEALTLMDVVAENLGVTELLTQNVRSGVMKFSEGHPYVIRVTIGELAREGHYVPPLSIFGKRIDILDAVFERSFLKLSDAGRRVFLTVGSWQSVVSELALIVVLGERGLDVEAGIEECTRLSLLERRAFQGDEPALAAPQIARVFSRKKLEGDPDRLLVREDVLVLGRFGTTTSGEIVQRPEKVVLERFIKWCLSDDTTTATGEGRDKTDRLLVRLAEVWSPAWEGVVRFRRRANWETGGIDYAARRAVEENPSSKSCWQMRADVSRSQGDEGGFISARLRAVELDPSDRALVREVAWDVCKYVTENANAIPMARRTVYLANVREALRRHEATLDATGLSRLAWLYLLEGNTDQAWKFAGRGLILDAENHHCRKLVEQLKSVV